MKNRIEFIKELSDAYGAPGFEDDVLKVVKNNIDEGYEFEEDCLRNLYITEENSKEDALTIMLDGHSDEVALIVQSIKKNGLMKFLPLGGWVPASLVAQKVKVRNEDGDYISGIISSKPPHFMSEEEKKQQVSIDKLFIDIGATTKSEVEDLFKINVGAPVVPDVVCEFNEKNNTFIGKAFDNRIGVACVVETMKTLKKEETNNRIVGVVAAQEEVGLRGAVVTSRRVKPDIAIVFEGTPADDSFKDEDEAQSVLGKGPQIRHFDRCMITNPRFVSKVRMIAKEIGMPFQDAIRIGGGTNGGPIHLSNSGVPTIVIGVPVRYVHTHHGITRLEDFNQTVKWAVEISKRLTKEDVKGF